jgi:hypothetical protein
MHLDSLDPEWDPLVTAWRAWANFHQLDAAREFSRAVRDLRTAEDLVDAHDDDVLHLLAEVLMEEFGGGA